jgi:hypothetical protein
MRAFITAAILTVTTLTATAAPIQAQTVEVSSLVDSWYVRYLGRHADPVGLTSEVRAISAGTPLDVAEAAILASPEYYVKNGNTPEGFVAALYRDVLGRRAGSAEFAHQVNRVLRDGRTAVALRVLAERNPPVVVASPPVIVVRPAPVVVTRPVVVDTGYRYGGSVFVSPRPGFSIRVGIR